MMTNRLTYRTHEIKDPIHAFIKHTTLERYVIDSPPVQRLRHVHQLALNYLVYPGATHKRFEHSLGVAELASRVFDVISAEENLLPEIREHVPELTDPELRPNWRRTLRIAAFCHDIGHLPFSHGADDLLPRNWDHERITGDLILSPEMQPVWEKLGNEGAPVEPEHIVRLALGPEKAPPDLHFTTGQAILSEIIVGDAFGVDRIDYLLRDAHHTGVSFGGLDHFRLIDTLRVLPPPSELGEEDRSKEPALGVEHGGLAVAEALLLVRYFMFSQVYFHPICVIYAEHLKEFLLEYRNGKPLPTSPDEHLLLTDNEVAASILKAGQNSQTLGHASAKRILERQHYRILYQRTQADPLDAAKKIHEAVGNKFGSDAVRMKKLPAKGAPPEFRVLLRDGKIASATAESRILKHIPIQKQEYVWVAPEIKKQATIWLGENRKEILA